MHDRLLLPRLGKESPRLEREGHWEREKVFGIPRSVLDRTRSIGRPVPQPVETVGHSLYWLSLFSLVNLFFQFLSVRNLTLIQIMVITLEGGKEGK